MSAWRAAGLNYIQYSNIAARVVRQSLKPNVKTEALKREESHQYLQHIAFLNQTPSSAVPSTSLLSILTEGLPLLLPSASQFIIIFGILSLHIWPYHLSLLSFITSRAGFKGRKGIGVGNVGRDKDQIMNDLSKTAVRWALVYKSEDRVRTEDLN
ncbi:unnamed protein product [Nezara viridula]|uniref:Uncharacterized protein n=1 Tax=Nezara viridula TaxID=85310 RepID=A0A9P0H152_NEZVI|nr:unnamed protein product [Nezara viridula]